MKDRRSLISASEVGDYLFCALAWRLRAEGYEATASRAARDAGSEWHRRYGRAVSNERRLRVTAIILTIAAVLLSLLLLLCLVARR